MSPPSQPGLPPQFPHLEQYVDRWAKGDSNARMRSRLESTPEQREAFCADMLAALDDVLAHLDAQPLGAMAAEDQRLLDLVLAVPHVALAVEQQRDLEPQHARMQEEFRIERSSQQFGSPAPSGTV